MYPGSNKSRRDFLKRAATVALAIPANRALGVRSFTSASSQYYSSVITQASWTANPFAASIAVRCRTTSAVAGQSPLSICSIVSAARMQISVTTGSVNAFYAAISSTGTVTMNDGSWHTIFSTYNMTAGGTITVQSWTDGVSDTAGSGASVAMGTSTPTVYVGARHNGGSLGLYWEGQISQIAYWNNVLTSDEIKQGGVSGPNAAGVDFQKIDRGLLDVADLSGEFTNTPWKRRAGVLAPVNTPTTYTTSDARITR